MRSTLVSAALVLIITAASGCRPYRGIPVGVASAPDEPPLPSGLDTRAVYRLPNGLKVVLEQNHSAPVVAVQAWVHAGAAADPPGQEGLAHLFQHLLLRAAIAGPATIAAGGQASGPGSSPASPTASAVFAAIAGRLSSWTSYDDTVFSGVLAAPFADEGIRALAAMFREPPLAAAAIEAAQRTARDDVRQAALMPSRVAAQVALAAAYSSHPYGRSLLGTDTSVAALRPDQVRAFFDRFYRPGNATIVVVGDFDGTTMRPLLAEAFGNWPAVGGDLAPAARPPVPDTAAPQAAVFTADIPAPELVVAFRTPGMKAADIPALELIAALLGPRRGGRLEMEIVRNRQLATTPRAYLFSGREAGLLVTSVTLGAGRPDDAARAVRDEVLRLVSERVDSDELTRARTLVEGDGASDQTSLGGYARKLGLSMAVADDPRFESAYLERLGKVDPKDLQEVAARTLTTQNLVVAVVLPAARDPRRDDRAAKLLPRLRAVTSAPFAAVVAPVAAVPVTASGRDVVEYVLPSGVRLLVVRDDTASQLSVRAVWSGGVRFQEPHLGGAAALLARLLPRATKTRGPDALSSELGETAGTLDGVASMDSLALRGDFLASRWERALELVVDCARNPRLADDDIERERRVLLDAIRARDDDSGELALQLFRGALFGRHPYHQHLLGTPDSVAGLTRRRLLDHFRQYYGPRGLTLAVLGPVEPARIAAKVQSLFADAPTPVADREAPPQAVQPVRTEPTQVFQLIDRPQAHLVLGYPGLTLRDPDRFALEVLAEVLGGVGGRLDGAGPREKGLVAEQTGAVSQEGVEPGYFAVYTAAAPDAIDGVVPALRAELRRLLDGGVTDEEVLRARRILVGTRALALERRGAVAMALALHGAFGGVGRAYRREVDELAKVSAADVTRAARRVLDPRREVLAVVRPRSAGGRAERTVIGAHGSAIAIYNPR